MTRHNPACVPGIRLRPPEFRPVTKVTHAIFALFTATGIASFLRGHALEQVPGGGFLPQSLRQVCEHPRVNPPSWANNTWERCWKFLGHCQGWILWLGFDFGQLKVARVKLSPQNEADCFYRVLRNVPTWSFARDKSLQQVTLSRLLEAISVWLGRRVQGMLFARDYIVCNKYA